jgi:single-strand DNA-binding protein
MAGETIIPVIGNLTADPELRFTDSGVPVAAFTVASTPRFYDQGSGQWKDGDTLFMRCSAWRDLAEHAAESLRKGTRVIVWGRLSQRSYQTDKGENRTVFEMTADEIGASLKYATVQVRKATRDKVPHPADAAAPDGRGGLAVVPDTSPWDGDKPPF